MALNCVAAPTEIVTEDGFSVTVVGTLGGDDEPPLELLPDEPLLDDPLIVWHPASVSAIERIKPQTQSFLRDAPDVVAPTV